MLLFWCDEQSEELLTIKSYASLINLFQSLVVGVVTQKNCSSESPDEIKRREMSWTLTKRLDFLFAGPGEFKRREVVLDRQESPEEIKSEETALGSEI